MGKNSSRRANALGCLIVCLLFGPPPAAGQESDSFFMTPAGFYPGPVAVRLQAPAGSVLHYTLDGSVPDREDPAYTGPIPLRRTAAVRARSYGVGVAGPVQTRTFLVRARHTLPVVSLVTEPANLWDHRRGIYVKGPRAAPKAPFEGANFWRNWERPVHVEFFEPDGRLGFAQAMGMKIHGGHSRAAAQKSLALFARRRYGKGTLKYPVFPGLGIERFEALVLRNSGNDWGQTMLRDALATRLGAELGLDAQAYRPAVVYINGVYWGLHNIREKINEHFLASHHAVDPDSLELLETGGDPVVGSGAAYRDMVNFARWHDLSRPGNYARMRAQMDLDNFRDYQIVQIYAGNTDWPGGNIKFWRPLRPGGRWRWLLFDLDFGFGRFSRATYRHDTLAMATADDGPKYPNPPWSTRLLRALLENEGFRRDFVNRFADLLNTRLSGGRVTAALDSMQALIAPEIEAHTARWGGSAEGWRRAIQGVRVFARQRPSHVRRHLAAHFGSEGTARLSVSVAPPAAGRVRVNGIDVRGAWNGAYLRGVPVPLLAVAAKGYRFAGWRGEFESPDQRTRLELRGNAAVVAEFAPAPAGPAPVHINEINYHGADGADPGDWIELYNRGAAAVDLGGWTLEDESDNGAYVFATGTTLLGRRHLVLCRDRKAFAARFPQAAPCLGDLPFGLSNGGERLRLADADGEAVDELRYDDRLPWPVAADGGGATLALKDPGADNAQAANWRAACCQGTPGLGNAVPARKTAAPAPAPPVLAANFPNPFNAATQIRFTLAARQSVRVSVYDALGRRVAVPLRAALGPGPHAVPLRADDWASGLYFYRVSTPAGSATGSMVLVR